MQHAMRARAGAVVATVVIASLLATALVASPAGAVTFTVDATYDAPDADAVEVTGNGICDDGTGHCTLRAP